MANKDFKIKNKLQVGGITASGPVVSDAYGNLDSTSSIATQYGGPGTTTSPTSGQILYSSAGTTYAPATLAGLPGTYGVGNTASRPGSPSLGQIYSNTETGYIEVYTSAGWSQLGVIPLTPTIGAATNVGTSRAYNNGAATVAFTPAVGGGLVSTYTATSSPGGFTGSGASSPVTVTGLQSATSYTFTIIATNGYGNATATSPTSAITATTIPQAPTIGSATVGNASATVAYTANATGGAAVSAYTATSSPGGFTGTGASPITVSGLTNGTAYTFTVTATNANGTSIASSASNSITPVVPTPVVTGGTLYTVGGYNYRIFNASGTLGITAATLPASILVVGAGGGGGRYEGGGGGGGAIEGASFFQSQSLGIGNYSVTVGGAGAGATTDSAPGSNGTNSIFAGATTITALGGGGGGSGQQSNGGQGSTGGSGGGGGNGGGYSSAGGASGNNTRVGGTAASAYGNGGAGGGGATAAGSNSGAAPNGGQGKALATIDANLTAANMGVFSGMTVISSGGGGVQSAVSNGSGGTGGGAGNRYGGGAASSFGSGGGGGGYNAGGQNGGAGYGGLVIVRWAV